MKHFSMVSNRLNKISLFYFTISIWKGNITITLKNNCIRDSFHGKITRRWETYELLYNDTTKTPNLFVKKSPFSQKYGLSPLKLFFATIKTHFYNTKRFSIICISKLRNFTMN